MTLLPSGEKVAREARRMRGLFPHLRRAKTDRVEHNVGILQESFVAETDHRETGLGDAQIAQGVAFLPETVNTSVKLNNQLQFRTEKIGNEAGDGSLAAELPTLETAVPKERP